MTKTGIEKRIEIWREVLRAVLYMWILEVSSTVARLVAVKFDFWVICGVIGLFGIGWIYILIWKRINNLILNLEKLEKGV